MDWVNYGVCIWIFKTNHVVHTLISQPVLITLHFLNTIFFCFFHFIKKYWKESFNFCVVALNFRLQWSYDYVFIVALVVAVFDVLGYPKMGCHHFWTTAKNRIKKLDNGWLKLWVNFKIISVFITQFLMKELYFIDTIKKNLRKEQ